MKRLAVLLTLLALCAPADAAQTLLQSTATTVTMGPFLDSTDGNTAETTLTITQPDVQLSKNGAAFAAPQSRQAVQTAARAQLTALAAVDALARDSRIDYVMTKWDRLVAVPGTKKIADEFLAQEAHRLQATVAEVAIHQIAARSDNPEVSRHHGMEALFQGWNQPVALAPTALPEVSLPSDARSFLRFTSS